MPDPSFTARLALRRVVPADAAALCRYATEALAALLGFRREGHFLQNVWFDEFLFAVLREEWRLVGPGSW